MTCRLFVSNLIVISLFVSSTAPAYAGAIRTNDREASQAAKKTKESLQQIVKIKEKQLADYQAVITLANEYGILDNSETIMGFNVYTVGSAASFLTAGTAGAVVAEGNRFSKTALAGAYELNEKIHAILTKAGALDPIYIDQGPSVLTIQTEYKQLEPKVQGEIVALLEDYGSKYSKEEVNGMFKALQRGVDTRLNSFREGVPSSYNPAIYVVDANESHWLSALRRARLRLKARYAFVIAAIAGTGMLIASLKHNSIQNDFMNRAKFEGLIGSNDEKGAVEYVKSAIAQATLLEAQIGTIEVQINNL